MFKKIKGFYEHNRVAIELVGGTIVVLGITGLCGYEIGKKVGEKAGLELGVVVTSATVRTAFEIKPNLTIEDLDNEEFVSNVAEELIKKYS